jgi:hypothetical protein
MPKEISETISEAIEREGVLSLLDVIQSLALRKKYTSKKVCEAKNAARTALTGLENHKADLVLGPEKAVDGVNDTTRRAQLVAYSTEQQKAVDQAFVAERLAIWRDECAAIDLKVLEFLLASHQMGIMPGDKFNSGVSVLEGNSDAG